MSFATRAIGKDAQVSMCRYQRHLNSEKERRNRMSAGFFLKLMGGLLETRNKLCPLLRKTEQTEQVAR